MRNSPAIRPSDIVKMRTFRALTRGNCHYRIRVKGIYQSH